MKFFVFFGCKFYNFLMKFFNFSVVIEASKMMIDILNVETFYVVSNFVTE